MASIYGRETYAIDHKGRVSIPASMRRETSGRKTHSELFLKFGSEGCLEAYQPSDWKTWENRLLEIQSKKGRQGREFVRAFLMDACWVTVDTQGRITIPPALLRRAGLGKEAVLLGNIGHIELWSPERFQSTEEAAGRNLPSLEDEMLRGF